MESEGDRMKGRASRQNFEGGARPPRRPGPSRPAPPKPQASGRVATQRRGTPVRQPSTHATTQRPHPRLAWYTGLAVMAVLEIIEWPLAIVLVLGHEIAHRAHSE